VTGAGRGSGKAIALVLGKGGTNFSAFCRKFSFTPKSPNGCWEGGLTRAALLGMMHGQNVFRLLIRVHLALILATFVWVVSRANSFP
jgi:hypothetical protein